MHPDIRQALAIARIDDLQREAARRQTIRLARRRTAIRDGSAASTPCSQARGRTRRAFPSSLIPTFLRLGAARVRRLQIRIR